MSALKIGRRAAAVGAVLMLLAGWIPVAGADPVPTDPARPAVPVPVQRPMPADPGRVNPIGGARISSTTPQGETAGLEPPLAAQAERGEATVPMWAKDGIFVPTAHPNRHLVLHLPGEMTLGPAAWTGGGGAIYGSPDVQYAVAPITGGGVDITVTRKTAFSASTIPFGITVPPLTHLRQDADAVVVETDPAPGAPARVIGTFTIPAAHDNNGAALSVIPGLGPGFPPGQSNLIVDVGDASVFAFPVTIALSYRASDVPTTGAPTQNWAGLPPGTTTPAAATDAAGRCAGGVNDYRSPDGRLADFAAACAVDAQCLATTPAQTSVQACHNLLLGHLSIACTATYGQTGEQYDGCTRAAESVVSAAKTTLAGPAANATTASGE